MGEVIDIVGCFSASSTVQVLNKGPVAMKDLAVGDKVMTTESYQTVYAFGHKADEQVGTFVQFNKGQLEMTGEHMVFLDGRTNPVRADSVQVGDVLRGESSPVQVTQIKSVTQHGLYAPLTKVGTVIVDGIVASSYISLQDATNMVQIDGVNLPLSQHTGIHMTLSPFRMVCSFVECSSYDEQGMAPFVSQGMKFVHWAESQHFFIQLVLLALGLAVVSACMIVESSMGAPLVVVAAYGMMKASGISVRKVKTV